MLPKKETVGVYLGGGQLGTGEYKSLIRFGGVPIAVRAIQQLIASAEIQRIVAVVPDRQAIAEAVGSSSKPIVYAKVSGVSLD